MKTVAIKFGEGNFITFQTSRSIPNALSFVKQQVAEKVTVFPLPKLKPFLLGDVARLSAN